MSSLAYTHAIQDQIESLWKKHQVIPDGIYLTRTKMRRLLREFGSHQDYLDQDALSAKKALGKLVSHTTGSLIPFYVAKKNYLMWTKRTGRTHGCPECLQIWPTDERKTKTRLFLPSDASEAKVSLRVVDLQILVDVARKPGDAEQISALRAATEAIRPSRGRPANSGTQQ